MAMVSMKWWLVVPFFCPSRAQSSLLYTIPLVDFSLDVMLNGRTLVCRLFPRSGLSVSAISRMSDSVRQKLSATTKAPNVHV